VLHRFFRLRPFTLSEQRAGKYAPSLDLVVAGLLRLKKLDDLPHRRFLFGGRTCLFQRQIRERELSLSDGYLLAYRSAHSQRLFVQLTGA
jgi:hypothetical protein